MLPQEALKKWLQTPAFDLELEDKRNDFIMSLGIELGSSTYNAVQGQLDFVYFTFRRSPGSFDFKGKRCGDSWVRADYQCRVDPEYYGMTHVTTSKAQIRKGLEAFEKSIERYSPEAQQEWRKVLKTSVEEANKSDRVGDLRKEEYYLRSVRNAKIMADDGPPTKLFLKGGEEVPVSAHVYPYLSKGGNMMWKDPIQNIGFTKSHKGQMELTQNRVTMAAALSSGQVKAAIDFYGKYQSSPEMQARGPFGTAKFAKLRGVEDNEVEVFWQKLSSKEKAAVALSGVDSVSNRVNQKGELDPRSAHKKYFEENPDELEWRGKQVVRAYLSQTPAAGQKAISPWTGLPVELPGIRGRQQGVVDHVDALSNHYPKNWTGKNGEGWTREQGSSTIRQADVFSNMVIGESGLNNGKGASDDWERLIPGWSRQQKEYERRLVEVEKMPMFLPTNSPPRGLSGPKPAEAEVQQSLSIKRVQKETIKKFTTPKQVSKPVKPETLAGNIDKEKLRNVYSTLLQQAKINRDSNAIKLYEAAIKKL